MGFEDLADIHPAGHAERVQHDVDRGAVFEIGHVLDRHDARDDALVAVPAGHLVARLQLALDRDEDLDLFHDARRQLVAALQFFDLALEARGQFGDGVVHLLFQGLDVDHPRVVADRDLPPLPRGVLGEHLLGQLGPRFQALRPRHGGLAEEQLLQPRREAAFENGALVVAVLGQPLDLGALDRQGALVLVDAAAREHPHLDDRAGDPWR